MTCIFDLSPSTVGPSEQFCYKADCMKVDDIVFGNVNRESVWGLVMFLQFKGQLKFKIRIYRQNKVHMF